MPTNFKVTLQRSAGLNEIPGDWTTADYKAVLDLTEFGDTTDLSDDDVRDMAFMSLADLPKNEAAELLMNYVFPEEELSAGQIQNASHEMTHEKLWEEYPEPPQHRNFFRVGSLLYRAYNGGFPRPEARRLTVHVVPVKGGKELLAAPTAPFVARLLAAGMDGHALIHRLYEDELQSKTFPASENIIWSVKSTPDADGAYVLEVIGSDYWLEVFDPSGTYECTAYPDAEEEDEED